MDRKFEKYQDKKFLGEASSFLKIQDNGRKAKYKVKFFLWKRIIANITCRKPAYLNKLRVRAEQDGKNI